MNNSFSLQQISRTGNLDSNLISRHYKLNLMPDFMRIKYENSKLKQSEIANQRSYSSLTLQRYRNDKNMLSPYRINPRNTNKRTKKTSNTNFDKSSHREPDVKKLLLTKFKHHIWTILIFTRKLIKFTFCIIIFEFFIVFDIV